MIVQVLLFGGMSAVAGKDRIDVDLGEEACARRVTEAIGEQYPSLRFALGAARIAVNSEFAAPTASVSPSDEIALIALVGGG